MSSEESRETKVENRARDRGLGFALGKRLAPYAALAGLVVLFFNKMVLTDLILARGDTFLYFYPYWQMAADALRAGEIPFWNPHIFMGAPLIANSQVGFFYPLNWPVWLLWEPPQGVKITIVVHLMIAAWGMYRLVKQHFGLTVPAAMFSAILFGLGGYLTAQVEHVNQLQGLAWLPWLLLTTAHVQTCGYGVQKPVKNRLVLSMAGLFTLQILAGHTQTVFLSGVACGLWLLAAAIRPNLTWQDRIVPFVCLAFGGMGALLLSAVQLLPTLELTQLSSRQGGLTTSEVLSFSWHPLLASQSLLPTVNQAPFTEYVAFLPIAALLLIGWVLLYQTSTLSPLPQAGEEESWWQTPLFAPLLLTATGLFLAFGRFNLVSWYYSHLPGLDLFRVPARWLILFAVGGAISAGIAIDQLHKSERRQMLWPLGLYVLLLLWNPVSVFLAQYIPVGPESPVERLSGRSLLLITAELILFVLVWMWANEQKSKGAEQLILPKWLMVGLGTLSLFIASRGLPYNRLTTPEAYTDLRPAGLRLQAEAQNQVVPDRFLSLSDIFFDPGDQAEIDTIYDGVLNAQALYDYTISIKLKEIVSPNFPMVYGLSSLDGFDGGILPLRGYSELMAQTILPDGRVTTDGRLREHLDQIPADEWLDKFNVRYIITDKVGDVWVDGVFFDRQHAVQLGGGQAVEVGFLPRFVTDQIHVLSEYPLSEFHLTTVAQSDVGGFLYESAESPGLWIADLGEPLVIESLQLFSGERGAEITAISLVNVERGWFQPVVPGNYKLVHSGDVKIYENLDVWGRAFLLPSGTQSLQGAERPAGGSAIVQAYEAGRVQIGAVVEEPGLLVLTDATYPGWGVTVNGEPAEIVELDGLLRGVKLPAGEHEVLFEYRPRAFLTGLGISLVSWIGAAFFVFVSYLFNKRINAPAVA